MPEERCENCKFWKETADDGSTGECQRYPPQLVTNSVGTVIDAAWPTVDADDWCGEWKPGQEETEGENA